MAAVTPMSTVTPMAAVTPMSAVASMPAVATLQSRRRYGFHGRTSLFYCFSQLLKV
jgi:hypothetical protein